MNACTFMFVLTWRGGHVDLVLSVWRHLKLKNLKDSYYLSVFKS